MRDRDGATAPPDGEITDLGVFEPDTATRELTLSALFDGVTVDAVRTACGWPLRAAATITTVPPPSEADLSVLRALHTRTRDAHAHRVRITLPQ